MLPPTGHQVMYTTRLSTGAVVLTHGPRECQRVDLVNRTGELTEAEWEEYCAKEVAKARATASLNR